MFLVLQFVDRYRGKIVQVSGKDLGAIGVVDSVNLLILRVCPIVGGADRQQEDALSGDLFQCEHYGNGAALSDQVSLLVVHCLNGHSGGHKIGVFCVAHPRPTRFLANDAQTIW